MKENIKISSDAGWGDLEIGINVYSIKQLTHCANSLEHAAWKIRQRIDNISKGNKKLDPYIYAEIRKECGGTVFHRRSGNKFYYENLDTKTYIATRVRASASLADESDEYILQQVENAMYRLKKQRRILDEETAAMRREGIDVSSLKKIAMLEFNKAGFFQNPEDVDKLVDEYLSTPLRDMHVIVAEAVETLRERGELYKMSSVSKVCKYRPAVVVVGEDYAVAKIAIIKEVRRIANCDLRTAKDATERYITETKLG